MHTAQTDRPAPLPLIRSGEHTRKRSVRSPTHTGHSRPPIRTRRPPPPMRGKPAHTAAGRNARGGRATCRVWKGETHTPEGEPNTHKLLIYDTTRAPVTHRNDNEVTLNTNDPWRVTKREKKNLHPHHQPKQRLPRPMTHWKHHDHARGPQCDTGRGGHTATAPQAGIAASCENLVYRENTAPNERGERGVGRLGRRSTEKIHSKKNREDVPHRHTATPFNPPTAVRH